MRTEVYADELSGDTGDRALGGHISHSVRQSSHNETPFPSFDELNISLSEDGHRVRCAFTHRQRQNVTLKVLREGAKLYNRIADPQDEMFGGVKYFILTSDHPTVFSYGGDFTLFLECIKNEDVASLKQYGEECISSVWTTYNGFFRDVVCVAGVRGEAFGGGFECVLGCDWIIAEASATIALPESSFGMYPGMGALSFLSRRIGRREAEDLIRTGRKMTGREAFSAGLVDEVCEEGELDVAIDHYIKGQERKPRLAPFFRAGRAYSEAITEEELLELVHLWAEAAITLTAREQKIMQRLLSRQQKRADREQVLPLRPDIQPILKTNPFTQAKS